MYNLQKNCPNVAHVFVLRNMDTNENIQSVIVEQVAPRGQWPRNMRQCQKYLNSKFKECALFYEHAGTGDIEAMKLLRDTVAEDCTIGD